MVKSSMPSACDSHVLVVDDSDMLFLMTPDAYYAFLCALFLIVVPTWHRGRAAPAAPPLPQQPHHNKPRELACVYPLPVEVETLPAARVKKRLLFEPVHRATPSARCLPPLLLLLLLLLLPPPAARAHHQIAQILHHVVAICGQSVCCRHMGGVRRFRRPQ